ncbi:MAG: DUF2939 domain-containing protein [Hyphomicrobiaceae bacterium]
MRGKILTLLLIVGGAITYIAAPFYTAWNIRDAAKNGKPHILAHSVYWPTVKLTLKESLEKIAVPAPAAATVGKESQGMFRRMWKRVKASFGRSVVHRMVDSYCNPEGFAQIFSYGRTYRTKVRGWKDPEEGLPILEKVQAVWTRVKRAEFKSWTRFELDMVDKFEPNRMYSGVLELRGLKWMLTEVRVLQEQTAHQFAASPSADWIERLKTAAVPRQRSAQ